MTALTTETLDDLEHLGRLTGCVPVEEAVLCELVAGYRERREVERLKVDLRGLLSEASWPIECHESVGKPCALLCDRWRKKLREAIA